MARKMSLRKEKRDSVIDATHPDFSHTMKFRGMVKTILNEKGWNLGRLHKETGIDRSRLKKILEGEKGGPPHRLHEDHVIAICKALGIIVRLGYKREVKSEVVWID